jgi:predicted DNA-binding transcriptional regulator YafY
MVRDVSPTARALVALEVIQNCPGITAERLGERLGVTARAARRYVAILREAELPIESVSGPYGGYRVGRGLRLPPLMFTAAEAMGLVMAVLEGHKYAADPVDPVGSALAKIVRVLPERVAGPVRAFREVTAPGKTAPDKTAPDKTAPDKTAPDKTAPDKTGEIAVSPELTAQLIEACSVARRLRLVYRLGRPGEREMEVDPWAVVLRHSRWYLLCWSHTSQARRVLRVDRIASAQSLADPFTPPEDLDALRTLEEHLHEGWTHPVDVFIDGAFDDVARWVPRNLGRLEPDENGRTRLRASTDDPEWYARRLAIIPATFSVIESAEIRRAIAALGRQLVAASEAAGTE